MAVLPVVPASLFKRWALSPVACILACLLLSASTAARAAPIAFQSQDIDFVANPTALEFGPDGRLYVAELKGTISAYTIERDPDTGTYTAVDAEVIDLIRAIPNHDDDGSPHSQAARNVTGLTTAGTAQSPEVYVSSSDPRIDDTNADTNSGMISRLRWQNGSWQRKDLVRGLPRSVHDHFPNGLALSEATQTLYLAQGGNTNMGAPSISFGLLPEYALSAAILTIDLAAIGETTYNLPTLAGTATPFGGQGGANQALLVPGGPVQVHASGFRNPYDVVRTTSGRLYTIDNGPNAGWGNIPAGEGSDACDNSTQEGGFNAGDGLHLITGPGYYGGHPNPTRANPDNTFNGASPVTTDNPVECYYLTPVVENGALTLFPASTNGLAEYTASNFDGEMLGDLLATSWDGTVKRITLNAAGDGVVGTSSLFTSLPGPLGITAQGDIDPFPGTIWIGHFYTGAVTVFEPIDFTGCDPALLDPNDTSINGFTFGDLVDNGLDPCNPAQVPPDFDHDFISDLNDPDIDNDGVANDFDVFAFDADNGLADTLPFRLEWSGSTIGALEGMSAYSAPGFSGLMTDPAGTQSLFEQFESGDLIPGGAAGVFTVTEVTAGSAESNTQHNGFHFGVDIGTALEPVTLRARVVTPFAGSVPADPQSFGITVGDGDQDHYIRLAVHANGGAGGIALSAEPAAPGGDVIVGAPVLGADWVDLYLELDPLSGTATASYAIGDAGQAGPRTALGATPVPIPPAWLMPADRGMAVGIISTSGNAGSFSAGWKFIEVYPGTGDSPGAEPPVVSNAAAWMAVTAGGWLEISGYGSHSFQVANDSSGGERITELRLSLPDSLISETVFDPNGTAGDVDAKPFVLDSEGGSGFIGATLSGFHNGIDDDDGFDTLTLTFDDFDPGETMTFSIDVDPNSIKGSLGPGPNGAGSVSGLEMTGAEIRVAFDDGVELVADLFGDGSDGGSVAGAVPDPAGAPVLEIVGISSPGVSNLPAATARIVGLPGAEVDLLRVLGGLFVDPSGPYPSGYDVGPHDINSLVDVAWIGTLTLDATGVALVPIALTRQESPLAMQNRFMAVQRDGNGVAGRTSKIIIVDYDPDAVVTQPQLFADPDPLGFGQIDAGTIATMTVTLTHGGSGTDPAIQVDSIGVVGDAAFSVDPVASFSLQPGESQSLDVNFAPPAAGSFSATLDVVHDGTDGWLGVALFGEAVELAPPGSAVLRLNAGLNAQTTVGGVVWEGDAGWLVPGSAGNVYSVPGAEVDGTVYDVLYQSERYGNPFGYAIPIADGTYRVRLHFAEIWHGVFTPGLEPGDRTFDVLLEDEVRLAGLDLAVAAGAPLTAYTIELDVVVNDGVLNLGFALGAGGADNAKLSALEVFVSDGEPPPPPQPGTVTASPDALDFGSVVIGESATADLVLTNPGEEPVSIDALGVDDPQGAFALQAPPTLPLVLAAGAQATVTIAFEPTSEGAAGGLLTLTHDGADSPLEVLLDGIGETVAPPPPPEPGTVTAAPDALDFGSVLIGDSAMANLVLANPGEEAVTIDSLGVDDPQGAFTLQSPLTLPLVLAAGAEISVTIVFAPISEGAVGGLLTLTHDGADSPLEVLLDGFGETVPEPPGSALLRINAGSSAQTTLDGMVWEGDAAWLVPGSLSSVWSVPDAAFDGTVYDVLYQTERYGNPFGYAIPVANGNYRVRLHFAEIWHGVFTPGLDPGDRIFDVLLEDELRLAGLDLAVAAGAPLTAHIVELDVVVSDGVLNAEFALGAGGVDQAKLSALEIIVLP